MYNNIMPSFKPKATKKIKIFKKYLNTLDGKHNDYLNQFIESEHKTIPELKSEKAVLKTQLSSSAMSIDEYMDVKDRIKTINKTIKELKDEKTNYLLDNSKFIFEYFENKKDIGSAEQSSASSGNITTKNQLVFNIFKINKPVINDAANNESNMSETRNKNIVQKYLNNVDEGFLDMSSFVCSTNVCQSCHKGELIPLEDEGVLICNICAVSVPYLIENEKPSYKEPPKEVCFYAYKKINHFKEILAQFQGKETTQIPQDVIDQITQQIKKERINLTHLTHYKTKEILKKLGLNKYYEHIAFIKNKLGISPPVFSPELEEVLCNLFMETQAPYAKRCPDYRVNFLNYYYVLFKFCELLDEREYLSEIPLLKDREKLIEQDETWKRMCVELNWEFIPTV